MNLNSIAKHIVEMLSDQDPEACLAEGETVELVSRMLVYLARQSGKNQTPTAVGQRLKNYILQVRHDCHSYLSAEFLP